LAAIAMGLVIATALLTGVVMARYASNSIAEPSNAPAAAVQPDVAQPQPAPQQAEPPPPKAAAAAPAPGSHGRAGPSRADIGACNRYAASSSDATSDTVRDAVVGGVAGAGLGAAGGAIADGGRGAGKGAGIGGLVGAAAGTLFGLNDANQREARNVAAYRDCMRRRGYVD
jgi:hypothetical protein